MTVPVAPTMEKHPQILERTYRKAKDQHGRSWGANIHGRTHDPVDPLQAQGWTAPWLPAPKYVQWRYDAEDGRYSVVIDYARNIRDDQEALRQWNAELMRVGTAINGQTFNAARPSAEVLHRVGPKPEDPRIPMLAARGDAWLLGLSPERPAWADRLFPRVVADPLADLLAMEAEDEDADEEADEEADEPVDPLTDGDLPVAVDPDPFKTPIKAQARRGRPPKAKQAAGTAE